MASRAHYYVVYDGEWKIQCDGENSEPYRRRRDAFKDAVALAHLDVMGLLDPTPRTADWYRRIKARPSFQDAIVRWENDKYLELMKRQGRENWPKIKEIMAVC